MNKQAAFLLSENSKSHHANQINTGLCRLSSHPLCLCLLVAEHRGMGWSRSCLQARAQPAEKGCFRFAPCKGHGSVCLSSKHVPSRVRARTSARAFLWDNKPRYSAVQASVRGKRKEQRHVTVVITSLCALLDDTRDPWQLQLGNGKCLNRTAWSSSPGSTSLSSGCHSSVQAHLSSRHLPQPGDEVVVQTPGRCRHVRMTTSLLNGSRLPTSTEPRESA